MENICYNCFRESLNEQGICTLCGFDGAENRQRYPLALPLGAILYGRYILGRVLGQGGFGITYLAQDFQTKGFVAVKEFFPDTMATRSGRATAMPLSGDQGENFSYGLSCFLDEAKTMAEFIGNPNITRVFSYFEENGTGYFVMEYLDGTNLQGYIKAHGGRIPWQAALEIILPIMDALTAMHEKGIIHRDVTPDNIYITNDGRVKLLDFGAARHSLGNVSRSLDVILKHGFAPMEQYSRRGRQGPYTDIYSLGATLYYAITGAKPDDAIERTYEDNLPLPTNLGARISIAQEDALLKALAVRPEGRYATVEAFRKALLAATPAPTPEPVLVPVSEPIPEPIPAPIPDPVPQPVPVPQPDPMPAAEEPAAQPPVKPVKKKTARKVLIGAACAVVAVLTLSKLSAYALVRFDQFDAGKAVYAFLKDSDGVQWAERAKAYHQAYHQAEMLEEKGEFGGAAIAFEKISGYADARERSARIWESMQRRTLDAGLYHTVGLQADGTVTAVGGNMSRQCNVQDWRNVQSVDAGYMHTVGLKQDGTVVAVGSNIENQCEVGQWQNIVSVAAAGDCTVGLQVDGTVVAVGFNKYGQCNVAGWTDVTAIAAGVRHNVALKVDGTVVAAGDNGKGQCEVGSWENIVEVAAGGGHTVGLKADGTVVAVGSNGRGQCNVSDWRDIVAIAAGDIHTLGLKADGTVVAVGGNDFGQCDVSDWKGIVEIEGGVGSTLGLKSDGTVLTTEKGKKYNISEWKNMKLPNNT